MQLYDRFDEVLRIAAALRDHVPRRRAVLFHGSPYPMAILRENRLRHADFASCAVHFSRAFHVGIYWASLGRDDDEMRGAVFVIDRDRLLCDYRLTPDCYIEGKRFWHFEAEELIVGRDVVSLDRYLLKLIPLPSHLYLLDPCHRAFRYAAADAWRHIKHLEPER